MATPDDVVVSTPVELPEIIDSRRPRIRRSLDLVRAVGWLLIVLILAGFGTIAANANQGANEDVAQLLSEVPHIFIRLFSALGSAGALAVPIAFVIRELVRGQSRRLVEALLTGLVAIGVIEALDRLVSSADSTALYSALIRGGAESNVQPLDAYLGALFAFVAVIGVAGDPLWRGVLIAATALYIVSAFTATQASLLSMVLSLAIGATVGVAERYALGSLNEAPEASVVAQSLKARGIILSRMERIPARIGDHRTYVCSTASGRGAVVQVFDRDLIATGAVRNFYRLVRLRSEIVSAPALSLERIAEHRSLLALAAASAGASAPVLLAGIPCGPNTIVLAYDAPAGHPFVDPDDEQLRDLWIQVERLHEHRVTHHGLIAAQLRVDLDGHVLLPILSEGSVFATDLRLNLDRVQLLVTTASMVGASRAAAAARAVLTPEQRAAMAPLVQPIAMAPEARASAKRDKGLLEALRAEIQEPAADDPVPEMVNLERVRPRTIVAIVAVITAAYLLVAQYGSVDLATVFANAKWQWVPLVVVASALTYVAAAVSLTGYVQEKLNFLRTVLAQLAASFVGFLTPPAVGGLAVNVRYLRKADVSITGAATSVGLSQVVNAVSHVVLLIGFAAATGGSAHHSLPIPGWAFLAVGGVAVLALLVLTVPSPRRWLLAKIMPPLREALPRLLNLLTSPVKLLESVGGAVALNLFYIAALWCSVRAFDSHLGFAQVAVVYLAGAAIGSVAPTPGGLGAVEVAMSTGLTAAGMPGTAAISAVLLFRLATFVLPVPAGWLSVHWLQGRNAL